MGGEATATSAKTLEAKTETGEKSKAAGSQ